MKKYKKIKRIIVAITFVIAITITAISPNNMVMVYGSTSDVIDADFSEVIAEDKQTATVRLLIKEKENQQILSVTMPEGTKIEKDDFQHDSDSNIFVEYTADKKGELSYSVSYSEKSEEAIESGSEEIVVEPETKEEKLTYEVSGIKNFDDMKLDIKADDIFAPVETAIDIMQSISIKDEDGSDVRDITNIMVVNYNNFDQNQVGTYEITYSAEHPVSKLATIFKRSVIITEKGSVASVKSSPEEVAENANRTEVGISLSSGNATLKNPEDFRIGEPSQQLFNLKVTYAPAQLDQNRVLKVHIPKNFELARDLYNFSSSYDIQYEDLEDGGQIITIKFLDNVNITVSTDVSIKQNSKALYDSAGENAQSYDFKVEAYKGEEVVKDNLLTLSTPKLIDSLDDEQLTIEAMDYERYDYMSRNLGRGELNLGNEGDSLIITKKAMSNSNELDLQLPLLIGEAAELARGIIKDKNGENPRQVIIQYDILENNKVISSGELALADDGKVIITKDVMEHFLYSYTERTLKLKSILHYRWGFTNKSSLHENPDTPFQSEQELSINGKKMFGLLTFEPKREGDSTFTLNSQRENPFQMFDKSGGLVPRNVYQNSAVLPEVRSEEYGFGIALFDHETNIIPGLIEREYMFPYELQPFAFVANSNFLFHDPFAEITIVTNKERSITYTKDNLEREKRQFNWTNIYKFNLSTLDLGEYIQKMTIRSHISTLKGRSDAEGAVGFGYNVMEHDSLGNPLGNSGKEVSVNEKVRTVGKNNEQEKTYKVNIIAPSTNTNYTTGAYVEQKGVEINEVSLLGGASVGIPRDGKNINNLNVKYNTNKMLEFLTSIVVRTQNDYDKIIVKYSTNMNHEQEMIITSAYTTKYKFPLSDGEYITSLEYTVYNIKNPSNSINLGGTFSVELYIEAKSKFPSGGSLTNDGNENFDVSIDLDGQLYNYNHIAPKVIYPTYVSTVNFGINKNILSNGDYVRLDGNTDLDSRFTENIPTWYPIYDANRILNTGFISGPANGKSYLENMTIDYSGTDKVLLSLVDTISCASDTTIIYSTNKSTDIVLKYKASEKKVKLGLAHDEYVTSIRVEDMKSTLNGKSAMKLEIYAELVNMYKRGDYPRTSPIDGSYLGNTAKTYLLKYKITGTKDETSLVEYNYEGSNSVPISGKQHVDIKAAPLYNDLTTTNYQGEKFTYILPRVEIDVSEVNKNNGSYNKVAIKDPVFYYAIDSDYNISDGAIDIGNGKANIEFQKGVLKDGSSLLKVTYLGFEETYDVSATGKVITPLINVAILANADAKSGDHNIIKGMVVDIKNSLDKNQSEVADLHLGADAVYDDSIFNFKDFMTEEGVGDLLDVNFEVRPQDAHSILEVREMGVNTLAVKNDDVSRSVSGHDNDVYKQELSIVSSFDFKTSDWQLYIPIPKTGQNIDYIGKDGKVHKTEANEFSMNLKKEVELKGAPTGTKIEYTTSTNPKYAYDGSVDGEYKESIADYSKVTMVRISIPEMALGEKVYPVLTYAYDGNKEDVGKELSFGGNYYNMKLAEATDYYYGDLGAFSLPIDYSIKDFVINGTVWEDREEPANHVLNDIDQLKPDVEVKAEAKSGNVYKTKTKNDGTYELIVPTHGDIKVSVTAPDNDTTVPIQRYKFVTKGIGSSASAVDGDGTTSVLLDKSDIYDINAGLWANRAVDVNTGTVQANTVIVKKGEYAQVPAIAFPTYAPITYAKANDEAIATVDSDGKVEGIKLGTTTATVSIPDGDGGIVEGNYTIKVIPANTPTVETDSIHMFTGLVYDSKFNVIIKDGDGNEVDINGTSDVKVTIDERSVDTTKPGKYPITYTVEDAYDQVVSVTRYVYVYGAIEFTKMPDQTVKKINTTYNPVEGAKASYIGLDENGMPTTPIEVTVTSTANTTTPENPDEITVPLYAEATIKYLDKNGAEHELKNGLHTRYQLLVNGLPDIRTDESNVTVKVGEGMGIIINRINAEGFIPIKDGEQLFDIDWSNFNDFDTTIPENTLTTDIFFQDPDTNEIVKKEITITVSKNIIINAPKGIDMIEGDLYNPGKDVTITDGNGKEIVLTPDLITKNEVPVDADGNVTTPGVYEVEYAYTDSYGNTGSVTTEVRVHGELQFNTDAIHQIVGDSVINLNNQEELSKLAWYINSNGDRMAATFVSNTVVDSGSVGMKNQDAVFMHPYGIKEMRTTRVIYTHGKLIIVAPADKTVKVDEKVAILDEATASYEYVKTDGSVESIPIDVSSDLGEELTSTIPTVKIVPLNASVNMAEGLINTAHAAFYRVTFNGFPTIIAKDSITVRVGATNDEIESILKAKASVHYGKDKEATNLTDQITWENFDKVDTSVKNGTFEVTLKVIDADGVEVTKKVTIKVSDDIIMNLPEVDKVIGDTFDPFEDVHIFDGDGNEVDPKDVIVDDSKVDLSKPGSYDVTYTYTDELGNEKTETNTVRVNGKLQFEGLNRLDLLEKENTTYVISGGKAYYIDYKNERVDVEGSFDKNVNQGIVGKNGVTFSAAHPVDKKSDGVIQEVYVHGDIVFQKPSSDTFGKVHTTISVSDKVTASYKHVNDDGTIEKVNVPVTGEDVTSDKVGNIDANVGAKVEIVKGLVSEKTDKVQVAFNGLPFIEAAGSLYFNGVPTIEDIKNAMGASAGMKKADGFVIDLTSVIDYRNLDKIMLDKSGTYEVRLTVRDPDGFTTYKDITVTITIPETNQPIEPSNPGDNSGNGGDNGNAGNNSGNTGNTGNTGSESTGEDSKETEDVTTVITKEIPLSKAKENVITDSFIKSYIMATSKLFGNKNFVIESHNIKSEVGTYEVTVRFDDGSVQTVSINVVDDTQRDVQQPEYGREEECIVHWIMLLLLLGYSVYSVTMMIKRRHENEEFEEALKGYSKKTGEGGKHS